MMRPDHAFLKPIISSNFGDFYGEITAIGQQSLSASGPLCSVGDICTIGSRSSPALAEVVAVNRQGIELSPLGEMHDMRPGVRVTLSQNHSAIRAGDSFAGRAVDAFGAPIDGGPPIFADERDRHRANKTMAKTVGTRRVSTGLRAIDSLLPIAQGQRMGIFAASGVGKTTLVEQISAQIECDRIVLCLIGERGREVERLWNLLCGKRAGATITLVAATSEESACARVRAMRQALALCEEWRDRGEHVVLFVDSATRLAMALRDIGLAAGEPPALRSYTPSVFSALPEFVERCGALTGKGAITALFTVLSETDDVDDPIVETMKSLLDGHIVLTRKLAEAAHYPAIDIRASVSRIADQVLNTQQIEAAKQLKRLVAAFEEARPMIESGLYQKGSSEEIDRAIALQPLIKSFLTQSSSETSDLAMSDAALETCLQGRENA